MRGGIAERGGIRVGHRIIEINGQSVVATPHDKIIQILTNAVGEVNSNTPIDSTSSECTGKKLRPFFLFFLADSLEDDASFDISPVNGSGTASISLNTACSVMNFCQKSENLIHELVSQL